MLSTRSLGTATAAGLAVVLLAGCQQDMAQAPYYKPLEASSFFKDSQGNARSSALMPVSGTVPRGELRDDDELFTGRRDGELTDRMPIEVTRELVERGMERFNIYCAPCHGFTGDGNGMIVQRGLSRPASFHIDRLNEAPVGYFYDVISNGYGRMYAYKHIPVRDRWAIVSYVRTLQYSQNATIEDVPEELRAALPEAFPAHAAAAMGVQATAAASGATIAPPVASLSRAADTTTETLSQPAPGGSY
jgi:mono/diheme cytochrome c family protein